MFPLIQSSLKPSGNSNIYKQFESSLDSALIAINDAGKALASGADVQIPIKTVERNLDDMQKLYKVALDIIDKDANKYCKQQVILLWGSTILDTIIGVTALVINTIEATKNTTENTTENANNNWIGLGCLVGSFVFGKIRDIIWHRRVKQIKETERFERIAGNGLLIEHINSSLQALKAYQQLKLENKYMHNDDNKEIMMEQSQKISSTRFSNIVKFVKMDSIKECGYDENEMLQDQDIELQINNSNENGIKFYKHSKLCGWWWKNFTIDINFLGDSITSEYSIIMQRMKSLGDVLEECNPEDIDLESTIASLIISYNTLENKFKIVKKVLALERKSAGKRSRNDQIYIRSGIQCLMESAAIISKLFERLNVNDGTLNANAKIGSAAIFCVSMIFSKLNDFLANQATKEEKLISQAKGLYEQRKILIHVHSLIVTFQAIKKEINERNRLFEQLRDKPQPFVSANNLYTTIAYIKGYEMPIDRRKKKYRKNMLTTKQAGEHWNNVNFISNSSSSEQKNNSDHLNSKTTFKRTGIRVLQKNESNNSLASGGMQKSDENKQQDKKPVVNLIVVNFDSVESSDDSYKIKKNEIELYDEV